MYIVPISHKLWIFESGKETSAAVFQSRTNTFSLLPSGISKERFDRKLFKSGKLEGKLPAKCQLQSKLFVYFQVNLSRRVASLRSSGTLPEVSKYLDNEYKLRTLRKIQLNAKLGGKRCRLRFLVYEKLAVAYPTEPILKWTKRTIIYWHRYSRLG